MREFTAHEVPTVWYADVAATVFRLVVLHRPTADDAAVINAVMIWDKFWLA